MGSTNCTQNLAQFVVCFCVCVCIYNKNKYKIRDDEYERSWGQTLKDLEVGEEVELM